MVYLHVPIVPTREAVGLSAGGISAGCFVYPVSQSDVLICTQETPLHYQYPCYTPSTPSLELVINRIKSLRRSQTSLKPESQSLSQSPYTPYTQQTLRG